MRSKKIILIIATLCFLYIVSFGYSESNDLKQNLLALIKPIQQTESYQLSGRVIVTIQTDENKSQPRKIEQKFNLVTKGDNQAYLALNTPQGNIQIYRNGEQLTIYSENDKKYLERDVPEGIYVLGLLGVPSIVDALVHNDKDAPPPFEILSQKTVSNAETGKPEEQFEIKTQDEENITIWFAKDNNLPTRIETTQPENEASSSTTRTFYFDDWNLKPAIEDKTFQFTPPEGVTKLERQERVEPLKGQKAPDFTLPTLDGKRVTLSEFQGKKVVVLDFWASWCGPCRMAMPVVQQVSEDLKDQDVVFFAVNLGEDKEKIQNFISRLNIKLPVLMDTNGDVATKYRVQSIPKLVIIDKNGIVISGHSGFSPDMKKQLKEEILKSLKPQPK